MESTVARRIVNLKPPKEIVCRVVSVEADVGKADANTSTCTCRLASTNALLATSDASLKLPLPPGSDETLTFRAPELKLKSDVFRSVETVSSVAGLILVLVESLTPTTPVVGELPMTNASAFLGNSIEPTRLAPAIPATFKNVRLAVSPFAELSESDVAGSGGRLASDSSTLDWMIVFFDRTNANECEFGKNTSRPETGEEGSDGTRVADSSMLDRMTVLFDFTNRNEFEYGKNTSAPGSAREVGGTNISDS